MSEEGDHGEDTHKTMRKGQRWNTGGRSGLEGEAGEAASHRGCCDGNGTLVVVFSCALRKLTSKLICVKSLLFE